MVPAETRVLRANKYKYKSGYNAKLRRRRDQKYNLWSKGGELSVPRAAAAAAQLWLPTDRRDGVEQWVLSPTHRAMSHFLLHAFSANKWPQHYQRIAELSHT